MFWHGCICSGNCSNSSGASKCQWVARILGVAFFCLCWYSPLSPQAAGSFIMDKTISFILPHTWNSVQEVWVCKTSWYPAIRHDNLSCCSIDCDTPDEYGVAWEDLELKTPDGETLRCYLLPQKRSLPTPTKYTNVIRIREVEQRNTSSSDDEVRFRDRSLSNALLTYAICPVYVEKAYGYYVPW